MKRILVIILLLVPCFVAEAQTFFGYVSYDSIRVRMPEYHQAKADIAALRQKYEQEAIRGEEEFQRKFTEFLQGQKDFPENILLKRQTELKDLMEKGIAFREECQTILLRAEADILQQVDVRLSQVLNEIGAERGFAFILNTDNNACPFINPMMGADITMEVLVRLGLVAPPEQEPVPATTDTESQEGDSVPAGEETQDSSQTEVSE